MRDRADVFAGRCWHVFADAILAWLHGEPLNAASCDVGSSVLRIGLTPCRDN